jgi:integrase
MLSPVHGSLRRVQAEFPLIQVVQISRASSNDPKAFLFQTYSRSSGQLTGAPLPQANAYAMIQRRAKSADILTRVGNHTFRATGVTAYLKNGGTLERAAQMANHASTRTTQLYDRRAEEVTLDEVERILV